jgi:hypothetical protein
MMLETHNHVDGGHINDNMAEVNIEIGLDGKQILSQQGPQCCCVKSNAARPP